MHNWTLKSDVYFRLKELFPNKLATRRDFNINLTVFSSCVLVCRRKKTQRFMPRAIARVNEA
jgi:hypothetical protein